MDEAAGEEALGKLFVALEFGRRVVFACDRAAAQVDPDAQANGIQDAHRARKMFGGTIDVLVQIDQAMFGAPTVRLSADNSELCAQWLWVFRMDNEGSQDDPNQRTSKQFHGFQPAAARTNSVRLKWVPSNELRSTANDIRSTRSTWEF
jgi:hypothetical protein